MTTHDLCFECLNPNDIVPTLPRSFRLKVILRRNGEITLKVLKGNCTWDFHYIEDGSITKRSADKNIYDLPSFLGRGFINAAGNELHLSHNNIYTKVR